MGTYILKLGLYERDKEVDVASSRFKPYSYDMKDFTQQVKNDYIPFIYIEETKKKISYKNGILQVDENSVDISNLLMQDFVELLRSHSITVRFLRYGEDIANYSTILLTPFTNYNVTMINGEISPLNFKNNLKAPTSIFATSTDIVNISVVDLDSQSLKSFTTKDDFVFYEPSKTTKIYINEHFTSFYIFGDLDPKIIKNGHVIANLVNNDD